MPRTSKRKVVIDGVERTPVSPELAAAIMRLADRLTDEYSWDRAYEMRAKGALVANLVPFAYRNDPVELPAGVAPPRPRPRRAAAGAKASPVGVARVEVSAAVAEAVREVARGLIAEFGEDWSMIVMAEERIVAASNARDGVVLPRIKGAAGAPDGAG